MGWRHIQVRWPWRWRQRYGMVVAIAIFILCCITPAWAVIPGTLATVDYAKSGHTLELLSELSPTLPVMDIRLAGIQAPDAKQHPWGKTARRCLADQLTNRVHIEPQNPTPDRYNRLWAYVWAERQLVNATVLTAGCAFLDSDRLPQQRYGKELIYAQEEARLLERGIWSPEHPLRESPAAFRQKMAES